MVGKTRACNCVYVTLIQKFPALFYGDERIYSAKTLLPFLRVHGSLPCVRQTITKPLYPGYVRSHSIMQHPEGPQLT